MTSSHTTKTIVQKNTTVPSTFENLFIQSPQYADGSNMSTIDPSKSDVQILVQPDTEGAYVLSCAGSTEWRNPVDLVAAFDPVGGGKPLRGLILDLQGIQYINSAGLGAIFALRKYAAQAGGALVITRPSASILRLLNTINLPTLIPVTETLDQARAAVNK